jgi:cathepsin L
MRFFITILIAALAFASAFAASVPDYTGYTYSQFLSEFRADSNAAPCPARKAVFEANLATIKAHNAQGRSWYMAVNEHADMTEEEFIASFTMKREGVATASKKQLKHRLSAPRPAVRFAPAEDVGGIPDRYDWTKNVGQVLTQGSCGSCWAFATAHTLNGRGNIASGTTVRVSTQQLTSCTPNPRHCGGTGGCFGATFQLAADYLIDAGFVTTEAAYPYISGRTEKTEDCRFDDLSMPPELSIRGYVSLPRNNKTALLEELTKGPVAVSVAASNWFLYGGGVFDGCTKQGDAIVNHVVSATGYDLKEGFLKIVNSWGPSWGENGVIRLKLYDEEPVQSNTKPLDGSGCEDEGTDPVDVVGECGVFFDSAYPTGLKVYS